MQTFLPLATDNYHAIALTLDNKRLNKQALEGWQIMMTLLELDPQGNHRSPKGWANHPAVKMWRGYEAELYEYVTAMTREWKLRGFNTTIDTKATETLHKALDLGFIHNTSKPRWMDDELKYKAIAISHRTALLNKNYEYYKQFKWPEDTGVAPTEYTYVWPTDNN